jgi:anti-anti-sigma regulatory factor
LPSQADIRSAAEIHAQCCAALEATGDVQVGCGAVERIDAAVLQCLGSLAKSLVESSRRLELVDRTEPFDRAVQLLGFDELLTCN